MLLLLALLAAEARAALDSLEATAAELNAGDIIEKLRQQLMQNNYDYMPPPDSDEGAAVSPASRAKLRSDERAAASPTSRVKLRSDEGAAASPTSHVKLRSDEGAAASPTPSTNEHPTQRHWAHVWSRAENGHERDLRREALVKVRLDHDKERRVEYFSQSSAGPRAAPAGPAPPAPVAEVDLLYYIDDDRLQVPPRRPRPPPPRADALFETRDGAGARRSLQAEDAAGASAARRKAGPRPRLRLPRERRQYMRRDACCSDEDAALGVDVDADAAARLVAAPRRS